MLGFAWTFIALVLGGFTGYLFFYLRYENRNIINELRKSLKESNIDRQQFQEDLEEHKEQNIILKAKLTQTLQKNDDLSKVVSELSRYYYKIKLGSEKIKDLSRDLEIPDETVLGRMNHFMDESRLDDILEKEGLSEKTPKKDFF